MKTTFPLLVGVLMTAGSVAPATAQGVEAFTGENLRDACDNLVLAVRGIQPISQEDPGAMLCLGYLAGWIQAMETIPDKPFCIPATVNARPGDLADLIVTYVDGHPDQEQVSAHEVLLETLVDAFPCPDSPESEPGGEQE